MPMKLLYAKKERKSKMSIRGVFERRRKRTRHHIARVGSGKLRLSVFRSASHIYAQVIDDRKAITIATASTLDKELASVKTGANKVAAEAVGTLIAQRAKKAGVEEVLFDRGGYRFHGRVKALADAARNAGLKF